MPAVSPPPSRRVRRLHLSAPNDEDASRAATLLTDALATASLPGADDGRFVLIRRLALGRISTRASASSLALQIAAAVREMLSEAVPYDTASAGAANAVAFPARAEAIIALAGRHARGAAAREWFWDAAVPNWSAALSRSDGWIVLLDAAHRLPEAAIVAAAVVNEAVMGGVEDELLSSIVPGTGGRWLRLEGWSASEPHAAEPRASLEIRLRHREVINLWRQRWDARDDRLVWLTTMCAVLETPARAADPRLPAAIASLLQSIDADRWLGERRSVAAPHPAMTPYPATASRPDTAVGSVPQPDERISPGVTGLPDSSANPAIETTPASRRHAASSDGASAIGSKRSVRPQREGAAAGGGLEIASEHVPARSSEELSSYAGLLFVVPILDRLGFAEYVLSDPELLDTNVPRRVIGFIGRRAGLTSDDPLGLEFDCGDVSLESSVALPAAARALLASPSPRISLESPFTAWLTVVRRFCRRHAKQGLIALIHRRGRVHISRTHIQLVFDLSRADVRLRRLALDVDPGWVPWLGRVVQFSYVDHHQRPH